MFVDPASPRHLVGTPPQPALGRLIAMDRNRGDRTHRQPDHRTVPCGPRRLWPAPLPAWRWTGLDAKTLGSHLLSRAGTRGHRICHQWCGPNWPRSTAGVLPCPLARTPRTPPAAGPPKQCLLHPAKPRHECGHIGPFCPAIAHIAQTHRGGYHECCARRAAWSRPRRPAILGDRPTPTRSPRPAGKRSRVRLRVSIRRKGDIRHGRGSDDDVASGALWLQPARRLSTAFHRRASGPAPRPIPTTLAS